MDIDSWQLPEEEPAPAKQAEASKTQKQKKSPKNKMPELKVQMTGGNQYAVASSTRDVTEIDIMNKSAKELLSSLAGRDRFHILFNANLPTTSDTVMRAADGKEYAVAVFGDEEQNHYRILVFLNNLAQPLIATADDIFGKLALLDRYKLNVGITEEEVQRTFPDLTPKQITGQEDQEQYVSYQLDGPVFLLFKDNQLVKKFNKEQDFKDYINILQGPQEEPEPQPALVEQVTPVIEQTPVEVNHKRLFSEIVYGPRFDNPYEDDMHRYGPDRFDRNGPDRFDRNGPDRFDNPDDPRNNLRRRNPQDPKPEQNKTDADNNVKPVPVKTRSSKHR